MAKARYTRAITQAVVVADKRKAAVAAICVLKALPAKRFITTTSLSQQLGHQKEASTPGFTSSEDGPV